MEIVTVTVNYLYIFSRKRARVLCIYRFNKVCLELLSHLKSASHIINILRLLGLYEEKISARWQWGPSCFLGIS